MSRRILENKYTLFFYIEPFLFSFTQWSIIPLKYEMQSFEFILFLVKIINYFIIVAVAR